MKIFTLGLFTSLIFISCVSNKLPLKIENLTGEVFIEKVSHIDRQTQKYKPVPYPGDRKYWSYDSTLIIEGQTVSIREINNNPPEISFSVDRYTFVDFRTKSFYVYLNFSDTAKIMDKYPQPDSGRPEGGWFFFTNQHYIPLANLTVVPDTTINDIVYKRVKSVQVDPTVKEREVVRHYNAWARCDKKSALHRYDNPLSELIGCPVVKYEIYTPEFGSGFSMELEFLRDKLTPEEIKVFEAWRKNAKENPVNK